jgi:hypothetical protein
VTIASLQCTIGNPATAAVKTGKRVPFNEPIATWRRSRPKNVRLAVQGAMLPERASINSSVACRLEKASIKRCDAYAMPSIKAPWSAGPNVWRSVSVPSGAALSRVMQGPQVSIT